MGLKGQRPTLLSPRTGKGVYLAEGEGKTIGVGDDLQEDVHIVKNGRESRVLAIVLCDLGVGVWGKRHRSKLFQGEIEIKNQANNPIKASGL